MFYIIETREQLEKLEAAPNCFIDLIATGEDIHPALTGTSVIYYNNFDKGFIITVKHSEGFELGKQDIENFLSKHDKVYLLDGKYHSYFLNLPNTVDLYFTAMDYYSNLDAFDCYTTVHRDFYNKLKYLTNVNALIPISKHYERCECMFELIMPLAGKEANVEWQNKFIEAYKWVEEQGVALNEKIFDKYYEPTWKANSVKDNMIYTKYNLYNVTSRPTNAFNGLNFLALPKDKSRAAFIPSNDRFIDFDFDGYHLRLIANLMNLQIPANESIHIFLGRQYFGKEELTDEEYQESKKITFRQLYNGVEDAYKHIELFKHTEELITAMWTEYQSVGYLLLPNGRKIVQDKANPQKLFNYYVQCLETVNNTKKLIKLKAALAQKKSKVVLVVYDSILVDFALEDGKETLETIKAILQEDGYLVKIKIGDTYDFS